MLGRRGGSVPVLFRVSPGLFSRVEDVRAGLGLSRSELCRVAVVSFLDGLDGGGVVPVDVDGGVLDAAARARRLLERNAAGG